MYNNNVNNTNPLFTLLGLTGGGQGQGGMQGGQQGGMPQQGGMQGGQQGGGGDPMETLMQLIAAMSNGQNAMNALTSIIPALGRQVQNHTPQELEHFTRNEYNRQGVDINAAMKQLQDLMNASGYNAYNGNYNANNGGGYNANNNNNTNNNNNNNY